MPRRRQWPPTIYHHASGQARIRINGDDYYLGAYGSPEAAERYREIVLRVEAGLPAVEAPTASADQITVGEAVARFVPWMEQHYHGGTEIREYRLTLAPLLRLYGSRPVAELTLDRLETLRAAVLTGSWRTAEEREDLQSNHQTVCRKTTNQRLGRILRCLKWLKARKLIPASVYEDCSNLEPLTPGAAHAVDYDDIPPVPEDDLAATLVHLSPIVRAIAETQLLTGARPGEILRLRPCDLDRTGRIPIARNQWIDLGGKIWVHVPAQHKTRRRGHQRVIMFGPKVQAILGPYLAREMSSHLFSPAEAQAARRAVLRATRKTPVQPSQRDRRKRNPQRKPGNHYTLSSYGAAIDRACDAAGVPHWNPHQLRHNAATRLTEQFGVHVAQTILGHRTLSATRIYAVDPWRQAADAILETG
jgi:integrase